jgi:hypothetical protein
MVKNCPKLPYYKLILHLELSKIECRNNSLANNAFSG